MTSEDMFEQWIKQCDIVDFPTIREAFLAGMAAEREECAKIADRLVDLYDRQPDVAAAIRERGRG